MNKKFKQVCILCMEDIWRREHIVRGHEICLYCVEGARIEARALGLNQWQYYVRKYLLPVQQYGREWTSEDGPIITQVLIE